MDLITIYIFNLFKFIFFIFNFKSFLKYSIIMSFEFFFNYLLTFILLLLNILKSIELNKINFLEL